MEDGSVIIEVVKKYAIKVLIKCYKIISKNALLEKRLL